MILIIDYGMGNLGSIRNMLKRINVNSEISSDLEKIYNAKKLILPGVGAFNKAMSRINEMKLSEILYRKSIIENTPILGICLGMQLLTNFSEEGEVNGLGLINANTIKFNFDNNHYKVPHMGWNTVYATNKNSLTKDLPIETRFYFVHSFYVKVADETNSILKTNYGGVEFDSCIAKDNIYGAQFHPEKSHKFGMKFLENFASI